MSALPVASRDGWLSPRAGRWVLLVTAVAQLAAPPLAGFDQGSTEDPVVVPPGPFFAVWGVVLLGCLTIAVRGLPERRATSPAYRRLHVPLSLTQVGFVAWLWAAAAAPVATVPIFAGMLGALAVALRRAPLTERPVAGSVRGGDAWVEAVLGVYAGWAAAAVWINAATLVDRPSSRALAALLVGAVATAVVLVVVVARSVVARCAAGATSAWALCGVVLSTGAADADALLAVAWAGLVGVVAATLIAARGARRAARPGAHRPAPS
ncbi:hypothetical protein OMK64_08285 [Cellulomonas fimi]|uniref:hypothetical protein n=1 Tax=Cellulomonas fimi TaxID=1708 RepID=UPI00234DF41F|nr:hypothetical protein [Cellulomonas fimi]MDC7121532.1 hypothetical protein [Cellulomonas fimi]